MMLQKDLTESCIFDGLEEWELEVGRYEKKKREIIRVKLGHMALRELIKVSL